MKLKPLQHNSATPISVTKTVPATSFSTVASQPLITKLPNPTNTTTKAVIEKSTQTDSTDCETQTCNINKGNIDDTSNVNIAAMIAGMFLSIVSMKDHDTNYNMNMIFKVIK